MKTEGKSLCIDGLTPGERRRLRLWMTVYVLRPYTATSLCRQVGGLLEQPGVRRVTRRMQEHGDEAGAVRFLCWLAEVSHARDEVVAS